MSKTFTYRAEVFFDELDALGILHHTRYMIHLERAQQKFFEHLLGVSDFNPQRDEDIYVVVHELNTRFRLPLFTPGWIEVSYSIDRIRSSGVSMGFTIQSLKQGATLCSGQRTVCKLSAQTHRPTAWTAPFRQAMEAYQE
ncbi:MAG: acyl-CoA thioester hydrolase [Lentimonas sp.]|jgi:acyl-CoA thioester hydrolase